jgi:hypothetical protein
MLEDEEANNFNLNQYYAHFVKKTCFFHSKIILISFDTHSLPPKISQSLSSLANLFPIITV